jgi:hypothetical protein
MASGSASYSTNATNYGRNSADAYYYLSAPDTINGPLTVTGNLVVDGSTTLTGPVTAGSTLAVAGNETVGGDLAVTGNETVGGTLTTAGALQVNAASVLNGNASVTGSLSVSGSNQLNLGTGSYLVNQGTNILANVGGAAAFSIEAARVSALVPLAVAALTSGSLGATSPVNPTLFGASGDAVWQNTGDGAQQATFVIAGWRLIFGTSGSAANQARVNVNFITPFATTCMPIVFLQAQTSGSGAGRVSGILSVTENGDGAGASPRYNGFQFLGVQAGGGSFSASCCWLAIGAA